MNTNLTIRTLSIISTCMLVIALGNMPYGYYLLLKMAVCATFITIAFRLNGRGIAYWTIARDDDTRLQRALSMVPSVTFYRYHVSFRLQKA